MRTLTLHEALFLFAGIAFGWGVGAMPSAHALQEERVEYRTIETNRIKTLESELNEAAREGCEPLFRVGENGYALVLKCES